MGFLTFSINLTLDGCIDHRQGIADAQLHDFFTRLVADTGALLYGRVAYELMEEFWPSVTHDEGAPRSHREFALAMENTPKYVASRTRRDFSWKNTFHVEGDLREAVVRLKNETPGGVLVGSPGLAASLQAMGLIDEYWLAIHPVVAGHGPTLFAGVDGVRNLELVETKRLESGVMAMHYRRRPD